MVISSALQDLVINRTVRQTEIITYKLYSIYSQGYAQHGIENPLSQCHDGSNIDIFSMKI